MSTPALLTESNDKVVSPGDINVYSLRTTLRDLYERDELIVTDVPVDPNLEIAGIQKKIDGGPTMLFENVKGYDHARFAVNLLARRSRIDDLFGFSDPQDRTQRIANAISDPIAPETVSPKDAPVQNVVQVDDIDVNEIIVPIQHTTEESEATIGSGVSLLAYEWFDGGTHVGYNRMNYRWGDVGTFQAAPGGHVWMVMSEHYDEDDPEIPITMNFGLPPAATMAAGAGFDYTVLPKGSDELGVAGGIQGEPIELVEAATVDGAYSIANAEYAIEGVLKPKDRRWETKEAEDSGEQGKHPFHPEWAGYMGRAYKAPSLHVSGLTYRDLETRPLIQPIIVHSAEENNIQTTVREGALFETVDRIEPGILTDLHIPYAMTDWGGAVFQVDKSNPVDEGYHRNFMVGAMASSRGMRIAIAVDTDIDIYSMDEIMWAITTRVNPEKDLLNPIPGGAGQTFQPSERASARGEVKQSNTNFEGGLAIDATVPYGELDETYDRPEYPIDLVELDTWFTDEQIEQAYEDRQPGWAELLSLTGR